VPAYRRIALPMLGLATLALPAAATGATSGALVSGSSLSGTSAPVSAPAATSATPAVRARVLRPGDKGADVRSLQRLLVATGIDVDVSGDYLYATSRAVQRFQVAAGLPASGIAGPRTIKALRTAARGPQGVEASGGLGFDGDIVDARRIGSRIPLVAGMSGHDVRQLQDFLRRAGVRGVSRPDGEFDGETVSAVRRFEQRENREVDGAFDAGDIYALFKIVGDDAKPGDAGDPSDGLPAPPLAPGDKARLSPSGLAIAPEGAPDSVKRIIAAGNRIASKPYKWGGGHGRWEDSGYDCSGSVSYALRGAGLLERPLASYDFFGWGESGKGRWVTIYTNSGHAYMVVAGLRFDTSGRGANGSRWQSATRDPGAFQVRHPAGL
jgi:peptidoglycan hydrolase-like protein with peptidoglycan-binding domain